MCEYAVLCRTLLVILETFSKFKNPRAFYRQEELWQLYVKVSVKWMHVVQGGIDYAIAMVMHYGGVCVSPYCSC